MQPPPPHPLPRRPPPAESPAGRGRGRASSACRLSYRMPGHFYSPCFGDRLQARVQHKKSCAASRHVEACAVHATRENPLPLRPKNTTLSCASRAHLRPAYLQGRRSVAASQRCGTFGRSSRVVQSKCRRSSGVSMSATRSAWWPRGLHVRAATTRPRRAAAVVARNIRVGAHRSTWHNEARRCSREDGAKQELVGAGQCPQEAIPKVWSHWGRMLRASVPVHRAKTGS